MKKMLITVFSIIIFAFITLEAAFLFSGNRNFNFGPQEWIHHAGYPANTIEGLNKVLSSGIQGIECDIFYIANEDRFALGHDWPLSEPKVYLEDILKILEKTKVKLWLDFKNADTENVEKVAAKLKQLEDKYHFKNRYFVESQSKMHQVLLSREGIPSVLWVDSFSKSRISYFRNIPNKLSVVFGDLIAVSFPIDSFNEKTQHTYNHLNKLVFTVNDPQVLETLKKDPKMKVVLKDFPK